MGREPLNQKCPACGSEDVPTLIVRGSGFPSGRLSLRCHRCESEWAGEQEGLPAHLRAS